MIPCDDFNIPNRFNQFGIPKLLPCHQVQTQPVSAEPKSPCQRKEPSGFNISPLKGLQVVTPLCCAV